MPPTKMRLGISVPYLGAARGVSSPPPGVADGGGAAAILCISAGVVSRRKLGAPKGRILRLFLEFGGARWPKKLLVAAVRWIERLRCFAICFLFGYGGGCCFRSAQIESDRTGSDRIGWRLCDGWGYWDVFHWFTCSTHVYRWMYF